MNETTGKVINKISAGWKIGLIPAIIAGIGTYITTRWYWNHGLKEGVEMAGSSVDEVVNQTMSQYFGNKS